MTNLAVSLIVAVQVIMAVMLSMLMLRNGRGNGPRYEVASEQSHPYELSAINSRYSRTELYAGVIPDTKLLELDKVALDEAYRSQIHNLWTVWLKGQAGDPQYFTNGLKIARRAYTQASEQIAKREQELKEKQK